jgi:O-antigen ligase
MNREPSIGVEAGNEVLTRRVWPALKVLALILFALFVGTQIYSPHQRVIKLAIALLLFWMTVRSPLPLVVAVLAFLAPFSAGTSLGPTNALAIVMVFLIWMVRTAMGAPKPDWKSPVSTAILALIMIHAVSFYNTPGGYQMEFAIKKFSVLLAAVLFFYLILNFVNDERGLERIVWAMALSCSAMIILGLLELYLPNLRLIPWFTLSGTKAIKGYFTHRRVAGPFRDGELLGEYMAMSVPLQVFMMARVRTMPLKAFWGLLIVGSLAIALATMHRAPLISMCLGVLYLIFLMRKRMNMQSLVGLLLLGAILVVTMEYIMANYTPTGSVMERIEGTEFYGGIPDSRRGPWIEAWERSLEHPWIGHGPFYYIGYPVGIYYLPHSTYLYYFYTIGIIGLVVFLLFVGTLLRMTIRYMSVRTGVKTFSTDLLTVLHVQLVVYLIDGIKIGYQRNDNYFLMVWLVFGMAAACYKVAARRTAEVLEERRAGGVLNPAR